MKKKIDINKYSQEEYDKIFDEIKEECHSSMDYKEVHDFIHKKLGGMTFPPPTLQETPK